MPETGIPSTAMMTSPARRPLVLAGPFAWTSLTRTAVAAARVARAIRLGNGNRLRDDPKMRASDTAVCNELPKHKLGGIARRREA